MMRSRSLALLAAAAGAVSMHVIVGAQSVIGPNVSVVTGISDQFIGDMFRQKQNEGVSCVFAVTPDQQMFAYNDYRTVDQPDDSQIGAPSPIGASLFARLFRPFRKSAPARADAAEAEVSKQAWIGLSFTDNGADYYTGLHPASPFSPHVPGDEQLKAFNFDSASDPVFAATPTHCLMAGIAFTKGGLSVGFVSRFTSVNRSETSSNIHYDFSKVVVISPPTIAGGTVSDFFVDKPYIVAGANGKVVAAFVVFDESDPLKLSSKVVVFTSNDYGEHWTTTPLVVSQPLSRNQSPWILLDPNNENNVYIGWRVFANPKYPTLTNAVVGKRSTNGGARFIPAVPYPVALLLRPYDVPQTEYPAKLVTPRSSAYPTAVIDSHGAIHLFMQEYVNPSTGYPLVPSQPNSAGIARITVSTSYTQGALWTLRRAFDYGPGSGPQFMPAAAVTGVPGPVCQGRPGPRSRLAVMYYDARASYPNGSVFLGGGGAQFDVRIAQSDPCVPDAGGRPIFGVPGKPSEQASVYTTQARLDLNNKWVFEIIKRQPGFDYPAVNAVFRMFNATKSFFTGDYIHITPKISYVLSGGVWKPTTAASVNPSDLPAVVFKGLFADTRRIILPTSSASSGNPSIPQDFIDKMPWEVYAPPHSGGASTTCYNPGSRDQNPYAVEISDGVYAAAPVTFRDTTVPRTFPVYVENRTGRKRFFKLQIDPLANASFNLPTPTFTPKRNADVAIGAYSSVTGSVIVGAGFTQPVFIKIQEINPAPPPGPPIPSNTFTPGGLTTSVVLNTATPGANAQGESRNPFVDPNPIVTKPFGTIGPDGIKISPNGPNPYVNPLGENPLGENPLGENPLGENPLGENTAVFDVTDITITSSSQGSVAASFSAILNVVGFTDLKKPENGYVFQALINRSSLIPGLEGCRTTEILQPNQISDLKTPLGENPLGENPLGENPLGENPLGENPLGENFPPDENASNSTFYLAPPVVPIVETARAMPMTPAHVEAVTARRDGQGFTMVPASYTAGMSSLPGRLGSGYDATRRREAANFAAGAGTPQGPVSALYRGVRPKDEVIYTLRVFKTNRTPARTFSPSAVTLLVTAHVPNLVDQGGGTFDFERTPAGTPIKRKAGAGAAIPARLAFTVQPASTLAGQTIAPAVRVSIQDGFGNMVTNSTLPVTLAIGTNPGEGTLSGTLTRNAVAGVATFDDLRINNAGTGYTLRASASGLPFATSTSFNIFAGQILIYGPSLYTGTTPNEQTIAQDLNFLVTVASTETWLGMTSTQFGAFKAIVFGDPNCSTNAAVLDTAASTRNTWSPVVTGPKVVVGTDPQHHGVDLGEDGQDKKAVARQLTRNAISFAASQPGGTGMYMALSCYYAFTETDTPVDALSGFGTFNASGSNTPALANVVTVNDASHPVLAGISEADLNNWGKSLHETVNTRPAWWKVIASQAADVQTETPSRPYIVAENRGVRGTVTDASGAVLPGVTVTATGPGGTFATTTDEAGRYAFIGIPSGTYTLSVAGVGFVPQNNVMEVPPYAMVIKNVTLSTP